MSYRATRDIYAAAHADRAHRYDQCDDTCTTDCGHCKGNGRPAVTAKTAQPDPQVVAWMRDHRGTLSHVDRHVAKVETVKAYRKAHPEEAQRLGLRILIDAYDVAARKPLTVADIPAGQGAASLFLMRDPLQDAVALWFKDGDGNVQWCRWEGAPGDSPASAAYWEHLAATLPAVTEEPAP